MIIKNIKAKDGKNLYTYCWDKVENPKAVIQIFHGMAEHSGRYEKFSEYLNKHGYIVYASDHRGHGKTAETIEELGYIGEDGFNTIVLDKHLMFQQIKDKYPKLPIFLFGHSFGSFLAQEYIIRYGNELKGVILSGSAAEKGFKVWGGRLVSSIERQIFGEKKKGRIMNALTLETYNKRFETDGSQLSWISSDLNEVRKYEEDPYCGKVFSVGFFYYLMKGLSRLYKKERLVLIPTNLPIYIISGEDDPVGGYGKLVKKLFKIYKNIGIKDVDIKLYLGFRHEIINEKNKIEVYEDILKWLNHILVKK
ncbi:lysophospholipase [Clostridium sp. SHJSY1]|uniref:alpha/beta hydrolase n=1 Tax=Clostridium sp. SHJSY1 TaxID=2942483 RepID=UPI0028743A8C|nr:lysophospholipase [Clostridium sp. SHJSY1]MDS0526706.1 lysophospholipase [Clostridium sp. SHJSY1]